MLYEKRHPEKPWLTPAANALLPTLLRPTDRGLEWGSGRSTLWLSQRLAHLTSVESDRGWHARVGEMLRGHATDHVDYRLASTEPASQPERSPYVLVASELPDRSLGFVLVDGDLREHCAVAALPKLAPGALLVVDNANWYLDRPSRSPGSRAGKGPLNPTWAEFERRVSGWRSGWTTSGVTDTAFWIAPP
jgi:predicted O-methyltransferase YrrM